MYKSGSLLKIYAKASAHVLQYYVEELMIKIIIKNTITQLIVIFQQKYLQTLSGDLFLVLQSLAVSGLPQQITRCKA